MYRIIDDLPLGLNFTNKPKEQLKLYGEWFKMNREKRLNVLSEEVKATPGFKEWYPSFTPESLKTLGAWLKLNVKVEKLSPEKYMEKKGKVPSYIEVNDWEMTAETYSKLVDVGIYFGEVFIQTHPGLKWEQFFSKVKNDASHGHMVIKGFGRKELNPIRTMSVIGLGLADNTTNENGLAELYEFWKSYLPAKAN